MQQQAPYQQWDQYPPPSLYQPPTYPYQQPMPPMPPLPPKPPRKKMSGECLIGAIVLIIATCSLIGIATSANQNSTVQQARLRKW